jgi:N-acyl-L-homoserine lactone synthetase
MYAGCQLFYRVSPGLFVLIMVVVPGGSSAADERVSTRTITPHKDSKKMAICHLSIMTGVFSAHLINNWHKKRRPDMSLMLNDVHHAGLCAGKQGYREVLLREEGYLVKTITSEEERSAAYRLRHRIFCEELKWVLRSTNAMESDEYDENAVFFGVFDEHRRLVSFLRLIMPDRQFMIEKEFLSLVDPNHRIRKEPDTAEISRLCVAPEARNNQRVGNFDVHKISLILFKGVYQWCLLNKMRYLYAVTELKIFRLYCLKGFPYRMIGRPAKMPDGVTVVAVVLDWDEFERSNEVRRPELARWFRKVQGSHPPTRSQQHEFCLRHSISA